LTAAITGTGPLFVRERASLLEVGSSAEGPLARTGEHDAAMPLLAFEPTKDVAELERGLRVESIGDLGTVEDHQENRFRSFLQSQRFEILSHFLRCADLGRRPRLEQPSSPV
jgi:hypothetical protein